MKICCTAGDRIGPKSWCFSLKRNIAQKAEKTKAEVFLTAVPLLSMTDSRTLCRTERNKEKEDFAVFWTEEKRL